MIILKLIVYSFFFFIKILFAFLFYSILYLLLNGPVNFIGLYVITYLSFFVKYFIPVYFIIYFLLKLKILNKDDYIINGKNKDSKLKLLISYYINIILFKIFNIKNFIIYYILKYKYISICIYVFISCLLLNFYKSKIIFLIVISFIVILFLLYYIYNILNKLNKFKIFFEKYIIYFNIGFILSVIYILKTENNYYMDEIENDYNFANLIFKISSPR